MIQTLIPDMPTADDLLPYLRRIDAARWYTNFGSLNAELEQRLALAVHARYAVTVSSATAGLELALIAMQLAPGSRVLCPAYTFPATATAIVRAGHHPVFADVSLSSWDLTPEIARHCAKEAPFEFDAVLPVCSLGRAQSQGAWEAFRAETGLPVLVDAAAAFGNQWLPSSSIPYVFSLHATKNVGAGEGGFVACDDEGFLDRIRELSNFGLDGPGGVSLHANSTNAKLSEYHAAACLASLDRHGAVIQKRKQLATFYRERLQHHCFAEYTGQAREPHDTLQTMQILLTTNMADRVSAELARNGIKCRRWYAPALNEHPAFARAERLGQLLVTQQLVQRCIGLPFHTQLTFTEVDQICATLGRALG